MVFELFPSGPALLGSVPSMVDVCWAVPASGPCPVCVFNPTVTSQRLLLKQGNCCIAAALHLLQAPWRWSGAHTSGLVFLALLGMSQSHLTSKGVFPGAVRDTDISFWRFPSDRIKIFAETRVFALQIGNGRKRERIHLKSTACTLLLRADWKKTCRSHAR